MKCLYMVLSDSYSCQSLIPGSVLMTFRAFVVFVFFQDVKSHV